MIKIKNFNKAAGFENSPGLHSLWILPCFATHRVIKGIELSKGLGLYLATESENCWYHEKFDA